MTDFDNGRADDEDQYTAQHSLSTREKLRRDEGYGDWKLEHERDRELEKGNVELIVAHKVYTDLSTGLVVMEAIPYHKFYKTGRELEKEADKEGKENE